MKTIAQIAAEIGVTKQAVHQKIKRKPLSTHLQPFISTIDGIICIDIDGEIIVKSAFCKNKPSIPSTVNVDAFTPTFTPSADDMITNYINSLKDQITILTADKENSQAQIANLQTELTNERTHSNQQSDRIADLAEKLAELTRNGQVLLKQEQEKNTLLLETSKDAEVTHSSDLDKQKKRPSWQFWKK